MAVTPTYNTGVLPANYTATVESTLNMVEKNCKTGALYDRNRRSSLSP